MDDRTPPTNTARDSDSAGSLRTIAVAVCTYRRNEPLETLLRALARVAADTRDLARVGVVVVDDNPDQRARSVVEAFEGVFDLGIHYRFSGARNISVARNLGLETSALLADWIAITDDDCEPEPTWLRHFLQVLDDTGADCVTGPLQPRVSMTSPKWLRSQPFLDRLRWDLPDGHSMSVAATNNSMIRSQFVSSHPHIRFLPELGVLGGEDMVFYRTAAKAGLKISFARYALVWENAPSERATLSHQLRYHYWHGNTECVTNIYTHDATRLRLFLRGSRRLGSAMWRPFGRVLVGQAPQFRFALASVCGALGLIAGSLGARLPHPSDGS